MHVNGYAQLILEPHAMLEIDSFNHEPFSQAARALTEAIRNTIFVEDGCEY